MHLKILLKFQNLFFEFLLFVSALFCVNKLNFPISSYFLLEHTFISAVLLYLCMENKKKNPWIKVDSFTLLYCSFVRKKSDDEEKLRKKIFNNNLTNKMSFILLSIFPESLFFFAFYLWILWLVGIFLFLEVKNITKVIKRLFWIFNDIWIFDMSKCVCYILF